MLLAAYLGIKKQPINGDSINKQHIFIFLHEIIKQDLL